MWLGAAEAALLLGGLKVMEQHRKQAVINEIFIGGTGGVR